jgi:hypothetical protein
MKEELTTKMHSEFTVSKEVDIRNKVGSAIESGMLRGVRENAIEHTLKRFGVTYDDYNKWKEYWAEVGVKL